MCAYMLSTAILCYMLRVYRERGNRGCNERSRRRIGGPGHAMSSPWLPSRPMVVAIVSAGQLLGSCWAPTGHPLDPRQSARGWAAGHPRLISRLLARLTTVSAEIAFKHATPFVLAAETHSRRNTRIETRCSTPARHLLDICSTADMRHALDTRQTESIHTTSHDCPSQPLHLCTHTHTHTNHTQHSIGNNQADCRHAALNAQSLQSLQHLYPSLPCQPFNAYYTGDMSNLTASRALQVAPSLHAQPLHPHPTLWPWFTLAIPKPPLT
jgi:hypothetical protein